MKRKASDLHLHTTASDGLFSPRDVVDMACAAGLETIAITDHDCVDALDNSLETYAKERQIGLIPGVELSCREKERDVHILGYFVDFKDAAFRNVLSQLRESRVQRCHKILELLKANGIPLSFEDIAAKAKGAVGRAHIARAMIEGGYVHTMKEAFTRYLGDEGSCYVEKSRLSIPQAIALIKNTGGVSVLAHPVLIGDEEIVRKVIEDGMEGIEVYHRNQGEREQQHYLALAREAGLLVTGGSDFHGSYPNERLGQYKLDSRYVDRLWEYHKEQMGKSETSK